MSHEATKIANHFLKYSYFVNDDTNCLDALKLMKLVHIAHGWYLKLERIPLFKERIVVGHSGPFIREVYRPIKHYREQIIDKFLPETIGSEEILNKIKRHIEEVYDAYNHLSSLQLSSYCNNKDSAWRYCKDKGLDYISNETMKRFYEDL